MLQCRIIILVEPKLFGPCAAISMQYYPPNYALEVADIPTSMLLSFEGIIGVLALQIVLYVDYTAVEDFISIEHLDDFSNQDCMLKNMGYLPIKESC